MEEEVRDLHPGSFPSSPGNILPLLLLLLQGFCSDHMAPTPPGGT